MSAPLPPLSALERRVVARLLTEPASAPELAAILEQPDPDVRAALVVLRGRDLVEQPGGCWCVTERRVVAAILNAEERVAAIRAALEAKASLGLLAAEGP